MTQIVVLPNENLCPEGAVIEADPGESVCRALLRNDSVEGLLFCDMKLLQIWLVFFQFVRGPAGKKNLL